MGFPRLVSRTVRLREAASTIFALVTLLPFLVLLYFLHRLDALSEPEAQVGLLLALLLAVLGFVVLQQMVSRFTRLAEAVAAEPGAAPVALGPSAAHVAALGQVAEIGQIGAAFARMLEDLRTSTDRLEDLVFKLGALSETVELSARVSNIQDLLALVLERSMRTVRATAGSIMLVDRERRTLSVVAARGLDGTREGEWRLGEGIPGTVAQLGETIVVEDVGRDPRSAGDARYGSGAFLCLPVRVEDRIIGVINLVKQDGAGGPATAARGFSPTDLQFLSTLVSHVAYSLDNARLLEETRQAAARLERALQDLQTAQTRLVEGEMLRGMGQMASGMAHHLNNLLAVVSGRIQLLLMQTQQTDIRRPLEIARQATEDAAEVVRRVLEFAARSPVVGVGSADLNQLVREVIELTRPRWHDQAQLGGIALEMVLDLGDVPPVAGEVSGLREVVMNLVLNAVDAMPRGGRITIRTWAEDGRVYCSVSDTGAGMSEEVRHRVFEPFFTTKGPQATGLGLAAAYGIAQRHGGELRVESQPGQGATFTIRLPLSKTEAKAEGPVARPDVGPLRILVVEDEEEIREVLVEALRGQGHSVAMGRDGVEGIRLAREANYDLVVTDISLPGHSGWEIAGVARQARPDVPILFVTGWGDQMDRVRLAALQRVEVLPKPFGLEELGRVITRLAGTPAAP